MTQQGLRLWKRQVLKKSTGGGAATQAEAMGAAETVRAAEMSTEADTVRSMDANWLLERCNILYIS